MTTPPEYEMRDMLERAFFDPFRDSQKIELRRTVCCGPQKARDEILNLLDEVRDSCPARHAIFRCGPATADGFNYNGDSRMVVTFVSQGKNHHRICLIKTKLGTLQTADFVYDRV
jgi:hypothetical protein